MSLRLQIKTFQYNPPVQDQFFSRHPNRRHTDSPVQSAPSTLPRYKYISPTSESSDSVSFEAGKEMASRPHRGYHTLDSGRKMPKQNSDSSSASDYGVAISIKGIKGKCRSQTSRLYCVTHRNCLGFNAESSKCNLYAVDIGENLLLDWFQQFLLAMKLIAYDIKYFCFLKSMKNILIDFPVQASV